MKTRLAVVAAGALFLLAMGDATITFAAEFDAGKRSSSPAPSGSVDEPAHASTST
jgi:hypothetical protein